MLSAAVLNHVKMPATTDSDISQMIFMTAARAHLNLENVINMPSATPGMPLMTSREQ